MTAGLVSAASEAATAIRKNGRRKMLTCQAPAPTQPTGRTIASAGVATLRCLGSARNGTSNKAPFPTGPSDIEGAGG